MSQYPVLVVGGGPSGLITALALLKNGLHVRIIEKRESPHGGIRGTGITPRTLEIFASLGVLDDVLARSTLVGRLAIHSAGKVIVKEVAFSESAADSPTIPYRYPINLSQPALETALRSNLTKNGVNVEYGVELIGIEQEEQGGYVLAKVKVEGKEVEEKFSYIISADGGRGSTRKILGIKFLGETPGVFEAITEPTTEPIASSSASGSQAGPSVNRDRPLPPPPPPSIPFSNHLLIDRRNGSISGQYLIDTRLPEPSGSAAVSNNLELRSHNGSVKGEVWIRGTPEKNKKATLKFLSHNGSVNAKIHSMTPATPLSLDLFSANGSMTLAIPRSFHGPLTLASKHGSLTISKALQTRAMLIREEGGQAVYHIQPPSDVEVSEGLERVLGESDARVESKNGSVKVRFEDEDWVASVAGGADGYGGVFGKFMRAFTG